MNFVETFSLTHTAMCAISATNINIHNYKLRPFDARSLYTAWQCLHTERCVAVGRSNVSIDTLCDTPLVKTNNCLFSMCAFYLKYDAFKWKSVRLVIVVVTWYSLIQSTIEQNTTKKHWIRNKHKENRSKREKNVYQHNKLTNWTEKKECKNTTERIEEPEQWNKENARFVTEIVHIWAKEWNEEEKQIRILKKSKVIYWVQDMR